MTKEETAKLLADIIACKKCQAVNIYCPTHLELVKKLEGQKKEEKK